VPEDTTGTNKRRTLSLSEFSPADAALDCNAIQAEQTANIAKIAQDNLAIQSNRQQNEVAGYMAALFVLPIVATESNSDEKNDIAALQQRQDVLRKLVAVKKCSP
jgi:hypothetical protein